MAERLGSALQKLLHRFESGSDLLFFLIKDMKFTLAAVFSVLTILFTAYMVISGLMDHWSVKMWHVLTLITLMSLASYFISQGAYQDIDDERGGKLEER
jgi:hypothetical protein